MTKTMNNLLLLILLSLGFITGNEALAASHTPPQKQAEYTIMVYLMGSDLETSDNPSASNCIGEMCESNRSSSVNLIVATGGCKEWYLANPKISNESVQYWEVTSDRAIILQNELLPKDKMSDPQILSGYIKWCIENYPSKKYVLILWDHGGGPISGYGQDVLNDNKGISLPDLKNALAKGLGGKKLELLGFDCCLMGNIEVASALCNYAKYMVGSEELEYGDWDYNNFLKGLSNRPSMDGSDLGTLIVKSHCDTIKGKTRLMVTMSLLDMSAIANVRNEWDKLFSQIDSGKDIQKKYRALAIARSRSESYAEMSKYVYLAGLVDMYDFADQIQESYKINTLPLRSAIKKAVIYNRNCNLRPNSNGVSIFFVDRKLEQAWGLGDVLEKYLGSKISTLYNAFMNKYYKDIFGGEAYRILGNIELVNKKVNIQGNYEYSVAIKSAKNDLDLIESISFITGYSDNRKFIATGVHSKIELEEDSGNIYFINTGKQFCIEKVPVAIYWDRNIDRIKETVIAEKDPDHKISGNKRTGKAGAVPVGSLAIKYKGETCFLVVAQKNNNEAEITYMWSEREFGDRVVPAWLKDPPKLGEKITILYRHYIEAKELSYEYVDGPTVALSNYTIKNEAVKSGNYFGTFLIEDILGRWIWSDYVPFTVNKAMLDNAAKLEKENKLAQKESEKDLLADAQWED